MIFATFDNFMAEFLFAITTRLSFVILWGNKV